MTDAAVDNEPAADVVVGRSLWGDAWARLKANRAAMFSLFYLGLMALVCIVGPWFVPHDYTTIYSDYVRTPPSTEAYPKADMVQGALDDVLKRMRVDLKEWKLEDGRATITVTSTKPVDERYLRYVDRSDTFDDAKVEAKSPDGLEMTFSAAVKQQYFLFGTDNVGRDLLSRTLVAGRISLAIGLLAGVVAVVIGVLYGATAGFTGGKMDEVMMRIVDVLYSLPFIFFVILLMVTFGSDILLIFIAIGAVEWLTMSRIVRGQTLSLKQKEFVEAAQAAGLTQGAIIFRHIVPNLLGPVVVYVTLTIPAVILAESFLSLLGLGVQPPMASLGTLIAGGAQDMELAWWLLVFPSLTMVVTLMCFNFIGDGLRDAIDPKDR